MQVENMRLLQTRPVIDVPLSKSKHEVTQFGARRCLTIMLLILDGKVEHVVHKGEIIFFLNKNFKFSIVVNLN